MSVPWRHIVQLSAKNSAALNIILISAFNFLKLKTGTLVTIVLRNIYTYLFLRFFVSEF